jgi:hypothetical protein
MGWLRKYRETAEYNFWTPEESLQHFKWSLEDLARDWFDSLDPVPAEFEDLATAITLPLSIQRMRQGYHRNYELVDREWVNRPWLIVMQCSHCVGK